VGSEHGSKRSSPKRAQPRLETDFTTDRFKVTSAVGPDGQHWQLKMLCFSSPTQDAKDPLLLKTRSFSLAQLARNIYLKEKGLDNLRGQDG